MKSIAASQAFPILVVLPVTASLSGTPAGFWQAGAFTAAGFLMQGFFKLSREWFPVPLFSWAKILGLAVLSQAGSYFSMNPGVWVLGMALWIGVTDRGEEETSWKSVFLRTLSIFILLFYFNGMRWLFRATGDAAFFQTVVAAFLLLLLAVLIQRDFSGRSRL